MKTLFFSLSLPSALRKMFQVSEESSPEPVTSSCLKTAPPTTCLEALSQRLAWNLWTRHWKNTCLLCLSPKTLSLGWPVTWSFLSSPPLMMAVQRKQSWYLTHRTPEKSNSLPPWPHPQWMNMPHRTQLTIQPVSSQ